ncbi:MAG: hypothetical protein ACI8Z1_002196 [Candidatus Azotimanducaceae bacterium]|jgi:hypothetical protein
MLNRHFVSLTFLTAVFCSCAFADEHTQQFGDVMPSGEAMKLSVAIERFAVGDTQLIAKVSGNITEVCQKKGCFMVVTQGEYHARVKFKDYGFFVPKDSAGKRAVIHGELISATLTAEQANHFESDAGRVGSFSDSITEYSIVASAVLIE